jgi:hypothetical protein
MTIFCKGPQDFNRSLKKSAWEKGKTLTRFVVGMAFLSTALLWSTNAFPAEEKTNYRRFKEIQYGFSFEVPDNWNIKLTPQKDYLVEGPKGSDAFEIAIIIQVILKSKNPNSSDKLQLEASQKIILTVPEADIKKQGRVSVAKKEAPYFVATYKTNTSQGKPSLFGHLQLVIDHGDYYYWVSFSGPSAIYEKYQPVVQHLLNTFAFK